MKFDRDRIIMTGIAVGMVLVFLFSQPFVMRGLVQFKNHLYHFLPDALSNFLWNQTLLAITFFWSMIFIGFGIWLVRGDIFAHEDPDEPPGDDPFDRSGGRYDEF
ncbi:MAG: hypothetical protein ABEK50_15645 [bacterium]